MATGSYQHFGFTLISTAKDAGVTNELPPESDASKDPAATPGVFDGLNMSGIASATTWWST